MVAALQHWAGGWSTCQCWKQGHQRPSRGPTQQLWLRSGARAQRAERSPAKAAASSGASNAQPPPAAAAPPPPPSAVAMDVEYSHLQLQNGRQLALPTWLAVVDEQGQLLLKTHIRPQVPPGARFFGGVPPAALARAPTLPDVLQQLAGMLPGRLLLGHGLAKDLAALGLQHPEHLRFDTMTHPAFHNKAGNSRSLKQLARQHLGQRIQSAPLQPAARRPQQAPPQQRRQQAQQQQQQAERCLHDPEEDAAAVIQLYQQVVRPSTYEGQVAAATQQLLESIRQRQHLLQLNDADVDNESRESY